MSTEITPVCVYQAWDHGMPYLVEIIDRDVISADSEITEDRELTSGLLIIIIGTEEGDQYGCSAK